MRAFLPCSVLVAAAFAGGCLYDPPGRCTQDAECADGMRCSAGLCLGCMKDADCALWQQCGAEHLCEPRRGCSAEEPHGCRIQCLVYACDESDPGCSCGSEGCWLHGRREVSGTVKVRAVLSNGQSAERVEFSVDGAAVATAEASPWEGTWDTTSGADGARALACGAIDARGAWASGTVEAFAVNNCDRDHDGVPAMGGRCAGADCDDGTGATGACAAATPECRGAVCVCLGSGATDSCVVAGAGWCAANGACVPCSADSQCGAGRYCDEETRRCVACPDGGCG